MSVSLSIEQLRVSYGDSEVLHEFSLHVDAGEFVTLLGPSGSGKTTVLNVVAGFVSQSHGSVALEGRVMDGLPAEDRGISVLFQNYALFPHMTVAENVEFPLRVRKLGKSERQRLVDDSLSMVGLGDHPNRAVISLSGGQRQRVALARALVFQPKLLLLDEPLAALDRGLREAMQLELKRIQAEVGVTTICVTHDQSEALSMSDRVAVLSDGKLEQCASPAEVYSKPRTRFVAQFLGDANLFTMTDDGQILELEDRTGTGSAETAMVRPENVVLGEHPHSAPGVEFRATVAQTVFQGSFSRVILAPEKNPQHLITAISTNENSAASQYLEGQLVSGWIATHSIHRFSV